MGALYEKHHRMIVTAQHFSVLWGHTSWHVYVTCTDSWPGHAPQWTSGCSNLTLKIKFLLIFVIKVNITCFEGRTGTRCPVAIALITDFYLKRATFKKNQTEPARINFNLPEIQSAKLCIRLQFARHIRNLQCWRTLPWSWCDGQQEMWRAITSLEEPLTAVCRSRVGLNLWATSNVWSRPLGTPPILTLTSARGERDSLLGLSVCKITEQVLMMIGMMVWFDTLLPPLTFTIFVGFFCFFLFKYLFHALQFNKARVFNRGVFVMMVRPF